MINVTVKEIAHCRTCNGFKAVEIDPEEPWKGTKVCPACRGTGRLMFRGPYTVCWVNGEEDDPSVQVRFIDSDLMDRGRASARALESAREFDAGRVVVNDRHGEEVCEFSCRSTR